VWTLALGILALAGAVALLWTMAMPSRSHLGPLPPLTERERTIRDRLRDHVQTLAGTIGERNLHRWPALAAAADYIEGAFGAAGYSPTSERFESRGLQVRNLVAERPGTSAPEEIVLVGAHYDSVPGSPGANDNGSGTAALAHRPLPRTLRLVAFVNEESPYSFTPEMGSLVHALGAKARGERIRAMLSLETIGCYSDRPGSQRYPWPLSHFYPDRGDFIGFIGNLGSRGLVRESIGAFRRHARFPSEGAALPQGVEGVAWSDHWSFWQAGYPAIMVTDTAFLRYPHYHSPQDTPDRLDYERTARVVAGLAETVAELAGAR
jgi:hypothetical protein